MVIFTNNVSGFNQVSNCFCEPDFAHLPSCSYQTWGHRGIRLFRVLLPPGAAMQDAIGPLGTEPEAGTGDGGLEFILLVLSTMWGPLVISWCIIPSNYSYNYHKP